jgi:hypothetical protein
MAVLPIRFGGGISLIAILLAVALLVGAMLLLSRYASRPSTGVGLSAGLLSLLTAVPSFAMILPSLDHLWLSRSLAAMVARHAPLAGPIISVGDAEPSLVFLLGTRTQLLPPEVAAQEMATNKDAVALVEARQDSDFRRALAARGTAPRLLDHAAGLDYSNGKEMTISLYQGVPK